MSKLFVVATPIGNLQDITLRALEIFNGVDWIAAEDTRVTKKLLSRFKIDKPIISCHKHSDRRSIVRIISLLRAGKNVAFVTDAGTPGISDPGQYLIKSVVGAGFATGIVSIPGPSALSAAISISDVDCSEFLFLGFPPHKKGRKKFFARVVKNKTPVIIFESPHRIQKTLIELNEAAGNRYCNVGRELTKIHEEVFRGALVDACRWVTESGPRGEFVIIVAADS